MTVEHLSRLHGSSTFVHGFFLFSGVSIWKYFWHGKFSARYYAILVKLTVPQIYLERYRGREEKICERDCTAPHVEFIFSMQKREKRKFSFHSGCWENVYEGVIARPIAGNPPKGATVLGNTVGGGGE
jgi:hypothetical protein